MLSIYRLVTLSIWYENRKTSSKNMMIYQLFMMAAISFAAFISMSDANCMMQFEACNVSCASNNQTKLDCETECNEEASEAAENPAVTFNGTDCVDICFGNWEADCNGGCRVRKRDCIDGCTRNLTTYFNTRSANQTEAWVVFYNCTGTIDFTNLIKKAYGAI